MTDRLQIVTRTGELAFSDQQLRLTPVNLRVLLCLIEQNGEVVTRATLFDSVWPNQSIADDVLTKAISDLRAQLKKLCGQSPITTIPKVGYRWQPEIITTEIVTSIATELRSEQSHPAQQSLVRSSPSLLTKALPWLLSFMLSIMLLIVGWQHGSQPGAIRIAILPVSYNDSNAAILATNIELQIQSRILESKRTRYYSTKVLNSVSNGQLNHYSRELGVEWLLESALYQQGGKWKLVIYLVDARTGLVTLFEQNEDFSQVSQVDAMLKPILAELEK